MHFFLFKTSTLFQDGFANLSRAVTSGMSVAQTHLQYQDCPGIVHLSRSPGVMVADYQEIVP